MSALTATCRNRFRQSRRERPCAIFSPPQASPHPAPSLSPSAPAPSTRQQSDIMCDCLKITSFPEKDYISKVSDGSFRVRIYGERSYSDRIAVVTHWLHNREFASESSKKEAVEIVKEYLDYELDGIDDETLTSMASEPLQYSLFSDYFNVPFPSERSPKFTFIDLFAGMGGFRLAMQAQGGKCVFSSEWNTFAQKTYIANFGDMPFGDITLDATKSFIPDQFDILCAGFPCQPFSIAGVSKKKSLGRETGFKDKTQGTLFFEVADIISKHRPKAFFLENVKNLVSHDKGNTFKIIHETLRELGYSIHFKVMDGKNYVPQHRERIFIVGYDMDVFGGKENFEFPNPNETKHTMSEILEDCVAPKYTLSDKLWNYLQAYAEKHRVKGNGFGYGLTPPSGVARTLSARYYKDGSEILIPQEGQNPRRLTPRECARLMGYPDEYILTAVSDVQAYRQCGNSVVVPLITAVAEQVVKPILELSKNESRAS